MEKGNSMTFYLTPKQERALEYFEEVIKKKGRAPLDMGQEEEYEGEI